jgi:hypothetical protein
LGSTERQNGQMSTRHHHQKKEDSGGGSVSVVPQLKGPLLVQIMKGIFKRQHVTEGPRTQRSLTAFDHMSTMRNHKEMPITVHKWRFNLLITPCNHCLAINMPWKVICTAQRPFPKSLLPPTVWGENSAIKSWEAHMKICSKLNYTSIVIFVYCFVYFYTHTHTHRAIW